MSWCVLMICFRINVKGMKSLKILGLMYFVFGFFGWFCDESLGMIGVLLILE